MGKSVGAALRAGGRAGSKRRHESARGGHPSDFSDKDTMLFNILLDIARDPGASDRTRRRTCHRRQPNSLPDEGVAGRHPTPYRSFQQSSQDTVAGATGNSVHHRTRPSEFSSNGSVPSSRNACYPRWALMADKARRDQHPTFVGSRTRPGRERRSSNAS